MDRKNKLTPIAEIYAYFRKTLGINARTVQWYATEGFLPKPHRIGREAFYDLESTQLYARVHIINDLQKRFDFRLWEVKRVLEKYQEQNLWQLHLLLEMLDTQFPRSGYNEVGYRIENSRSVNVHTQFFKELEEGASIDSLSLVKIEEEVDEQEGNARRDWPPLRH
jgi:DNA-binding transcriptional MerR regulator